MKFRNPKTGEVYEDIQEAFSLHNCIDECRECIFDKTNNGAGVNCGAFAEKFPEQAASLMGYEIIQDETDSEPNTPKQECKKDAGKPRIALVPMQILRDVAEVRGWAVDNKYHDPDNWKDVELDRYINAMLRHTIAFVEDMESKDEESGLYHQYHAETNWAFISELLKRTRESLCQNKTLFLLRYKRSTELSCNRIGYLLSSIAKTRQ